ncbi:collagen-like protein [Methylobacterium haplocladii]|uniref:Collagen-like protein n=1 Tax=Methylobacterium haplocladii TaxID=1176176 RepID=A0A512IN03_9HYPH|nr:collagen-like protein [Methylobacterium haplocladii]GEO99086.1 hypothetical protein MHA02_14740 [Methylobacterium haplocladii]GJD84068.1 hypothetical protein HPGCJGGD_1943 [Methylobacterium haplocladii]
MIERVVAALALILSAASPALAQQPPAPAPQAQPDAASSKSRARRPQQPAQPIMVYDARIEAGDLRISGSVRKGGLVVILDDEISVAADSRGRFVFKLPYRPRTCVAALKAGEDEREAVIANCAPEGEAGPKGEPGPTGPQGVAGVQGPPGPQGVEGAPGVAGAPGARGEAGAKGDLGPKGDAGSSGEAGAQGPTGPAAASLRALRSGTCPDTGCELACDSGEVLVSAYCFGSATPTYRASAGGTATAACPAGGEGMAAFCTRP